MTKFVLDASVALKWTVDEPHSDIARQLRENFQNGVHELLAPDIFPYEIGHVFSKMHRQHKITAKEAELYVADVLSTVPDLHPSLPLMQRALELSLQVRKGIWDCFYHALREQEDCQIITADTGMIINPRSSDVVHLKDL